MKNMKKCPPGVICLENATMLFIVLALGAIAMFIWNNQKGTMSKELNQTLGCRQNSVIGMVLSIQLLSKY